MEKLTRAEIDKQTEQFIGKMVVGVIIIITFLLLQPATYQKPKPTLTKDDKQQIIMQVGINGLKTINNYGCQNDIAEYIHTGEWSGGWCAEHYNHLKFNAKKTLSK